MHNLQISSRAALAGFWRLQVVDPVSRVVRRDTGWFPNLITDIGLEAIGEPKALGLCCVVGEGNAAPSVANTTLQLPIAKRGPGVAGTIVDSVGIVTTGDRYSWQRRSYQFAQGAVVGNVAEIGVGWTDALGTPVFSRSLVSPAVTLIAQDILIATYELRTYLPTVDSTGTVTLEGLPYNFTIRPLMASNATAAGQSTFGWVTQLLNSTAGVRAWTGLSSCARTFAPPVILTPIDQGPSIWTAADTNATQISASPSTVTNEAYEAGQLRCNWSWMWDIANSNHASGIGGLSYTGMFGTYQCIFNTPIPKTATKQLTLRFRQSWARR